MTGMAKMAPIVNETLKKTVMVSVGPMAVGIAPIAESGAMMKLRIGVTKSIEIPVPMMRAPTIHSSRLRSSTR